MANINKVVKSNRSTVPGVGADLNLPVKAGDFNKLVDRVNSLTSEDSTLNQTLTAVTATTGTFTSLTGTSATLGVTTYKSNVIDTGGVYATPVVLTAAQSGSLILVNAAAGLDFTLPAISASDIGMRFEFLVTVTITSNNFRVTAAAGDLLNGGVTMIDFDAAYTAPQAVFVEPDFSDDLVMTCNGSTTGGKKGTRVVFEAVSATQWFVSGTIAADGVIATPFS